MDGNQLKALNGKFNTEMVLELLKELQGQHAISYCTKDYRNGYPEYSSTQFFAPFYLRFESGESWLLFPTNSIRTDRINIQQWNCYHLKKLNPSITKGYVVIPEEMIAKEKNLADSYQEKIATKSIFSPIDGIVTPKQLVDLIVNK